MSQGALKGDCPAEVVASCDITFSCVSDPTALRDVCSMFLCLNVYCGSDYIVLYVFIRPFNSHIILVGV